MSRVTQARKARTPSRKRQSMNRLIRQWWARTRSGRYHAGIHFVAGKPAWITLEVGGLPATHGEFSLAAGLTPLPGCDSAEWIYDGSLLFGDPKET